MNAKRAVVWGAIGGLIFGFAMLLVGTSIGETVPPGSDTFVSQYLAACLYVIHWPVLSLLPSTSDLYRWVAVVLVGYWIIIGVAAGLLFSLIRDWKVRRRRGPVMCVGWVLGTFALHCWVLLALAGLPGWEGEKSNVRSLTEGLNAAVAGYELPPEKRAQERAAMQMRGDKLSYALRAEENAVSYFVQVATIADRAGRRVARRAWISWAIIAFAPVIFFALITTRQRPGDKSPQADAPRAGEPD